MDSLFYQMTGWRSWHLYPHFLSERFVQHLYSCCSIDCTTGVFAGATVIYKIIFLYVVMKSLLRYMLMKIKNGKLLYRLGALVKSLNISWGMHLELVHVRRFCKRAAIFVHYFLILQQVSTLVIPLCCFLLPSSL